MDNLTEHVVGTINGTACEIEYRDSSGEIVGLWAYGAFDPSLPYQGTTGTEPPAEAPK